MSGMMPGAWPTFRGWRKDQNVLSVTNSVPATPKDIPQEKSQNRDSFWSRKKLHGGWPTLTGRGTKTSTAKHSKTDRYAISSSLRRAALETMFDPPVSQLEEFMRVESSEKDSVSVIDDMASGQIYEESIATTVQMLAGEERNLSQDTEKTAEDTSTAVPDVPDITNGTGDADWSKYLAWMEDDMSFEERINNNMLLDGSLVQEVSSNQTFIYLGLDLQHHHGQMMLLFKDLPAMNQGKHIGQAMYILGYDLARPGFFLRFFEKLPSTIYVLPQHWNFGIETLRLTVGEVFHILQDNDCLDLSVFQQSILPEWDEELGFKLVVLIMFGQWILDFERALICDKETTEIMRRLLVKWRESLPAGLNEVKKSIHDIDDGVLETQFHEEKGNMKGAQEFAAVDLSMESPLVQTSQLSSFSDDGSPRYAMSSIKVPRIRKRQTYDSDEEEEWAALEKWAASKKQESALKALNHEQTSETALVAPALSLDDNIDPTNAFVTRERAKSLVEVLDLGNPTDAKRFSDISTLCDACEGNKEKPTFANTLRSAMLSEGSIEAMMEVYLDFVKKHPEQDSERKRTELFKFLLGHVEEKDGGSVSVGKTLEDLKSMSVTEEEAEAC
ncbi:MAG: hypothetical protein M1830_003950 [Pleopsidium flavum]|nr:MAG: hypothetical protein M1830_003950 [Pleopsidium flavum]